MKPILNLKIKSETEIKGKGNLILSETELEEKTKWTQSETKLEGAFHRGGLSLRFHLRHLLIGGLPLGLKLPLSINLY